MLHTNNQIIKHKVGLLNLAEGSSPQKIIEVKSRILSYYKIRRKI